MGLCGPAPADHPERKEVNAHMLEVLKGLLLRDERGKLYEYGLLIALFVLLGGGVVIGLYVQSTGVMEAVPEIFFEILAETQYGH